MAGHPVLSETSAIPKARVEAILANGRPRTMYECHCGRTFPGTLTGAWEAKVHAEREGHPLVDAHERGLKPRAAALA